MNARATANTVTPITDRPWRFRKLFTVYLSYLPFVGGENGTVNQWIQNKIVTIDVLVWQAGAGILYLCDVASFLAFTHVVCESHLQGGGVFDRS